MKAFKIERGSEMKTISKLNSIVRNFAHTSVRQGFPQVQIPSDCEFTDSKLSKSYNMISGCDFSKYQKEQLKEVVK